MYQVWRRWLLNGERMMKILQIGLGSMGKRRIRNLQYLGVKDIIAYDVSEARRQEVETLYGVKTINSMDIAPWELITHMVISTPPDKHVDYAIIGVKKSIHVFIEASVVDDGYEELAGLAAESPSLLAPSCTMRFDPLNKRLKQWLDEKRIGELLFAQHHFGLHLPKWHPWESIHDFYVSNNKTGAAREIVPFDMVYLNWLLGDPVELTAFKENSGTLGADIDDIYALSYRAKKCKLVQMTIEVLSKVPYRTTRIIGENGNIELDTVNGSLSLFDSHLGVWEKLKRSDLAETKSTEEMYVLEMDCFLRASEGEGEFPHTLNEDWQVLKYLYSAEESANKGHLVL